MTLPIISLLRSKTDITLTKQFYSDAFGGRVSLMTAFKNEPAHYKGISNNLWIDLSLDFLPNLLQKEGSNEDANKREKKFFSEKCKGDILFARNEISKKGNEAKLKDVITGLVGIASEYKPQILGLPQYPYDASKGTSKANRAITNIVRSLPRKCPLVVPVIIQNRSWTRYKKSRNEIVKEIEATCSLLKPEYLWIVDASLNDDEGSGTLAKERLPNLVTLHKEIREVSKGTSIIAGPYWGMNLVLWARGLADFIAITPGGSSQYYPECSVVKRSPSISRVALPPLRRLVKKSPELKDWIKDVLRLDLPSREVVEQFHKLEKELGKLDGDIAKKQVADFYSSWLRSICTLPAQGRAFGLYQDLSMAYALGSILPKLLGEKSAGANASHVAEALMLNVLG
jgi:hypothetical protein